MLKNSIKVLVYKLFFFRKNKNMLRKGIKRAFFFKELVEDYINKLVLFYYDGNHPKHHLWVDYYKFIVENIKPNDTVLDVGCGGSMSYNQELTNKVNFIDAIDINNILIQQCVDKNQFENIHFFVLDITKDLPSKKYDVVILSHVLEHLSHPEDLLTKIKKITNKIIIRLPRYDDHWMYLVKKDLGMFYFKDRDHKQEFTLDSARKLIQGSGWNIVKAFNDIDIKIVATINNPI